MKKSILLATAVALLAACSETPVTQRSIPVTPTDSRTATGLDVYGYARATGNTAPRFRGTGFLNVRTTASRNGIAYSEVAGASCNLDSGLFVASFQTPANIIVPDYGPDSPAIVVTCTDNEGRTATATSDVANLTKQRRGPSSLTAGLLGTVRNTEKDDFGYNPITLTLQ